MQLAEIQTNKTMSSREIAQLCQKRHDNVCNDIRILNETYEKMGLLKIKDTLYTNEQNGQKYREYLLTKEQGYLELVSVVTYNTGEAVLIDEQLISEGVV